LDSKDLGAALVVVRDADIWWAVKWCLIFIALTCVRSGEAREATWDEVDLDKAVWKIPAARMKRPEEHKVPLSLRPWRCCATREAKVSTALAWSFRPNVLANA